MTDRDKIRAAISNAYYDTRNTGGTMETAADRAADAVFALLAVDAARLRAAMALRNDLLSWNPGHGDYKTAGRELDRALYVTPADDPYIPDL